MSDMVYIFLNGAAILLLLFAAAFFASAETAYTGISRIKIRQMVKNGERHADLVSRLKDNLDFLIATLLIGTNFVNTLNSALVTAFVLKVFGPERVSAGTAIITVLIIVIAEIIPKTYAAVVPERVVKSASVPVNVIQKIFWPLIFVFFKLTRFVDFLEKRLIKSKRPFITQEELKTLIAVGGNEGTLERDERKMLERLFEFSDLTAREMMRHRSLVKYLSCDESYENTVRLFTETGYSYIPVYEKTPENIIGVLHFKSVLFADKMIAASPDFVRICMNDVLFIPETFTAVDILKKFKKEKNRFAVVLNEYGGLAGIITLDDILKEVFGRITDEHGRIEASPEKRISVINVNEFLIPGDMRLEDLNEILYFNLTSNNFDTLGGWLLEKIGALPPVGYVYKHNSAVFIVEDQSARRIQTVRIKL